MTGRTAPALLAVVVLGAGGGAKSFAASDPDPAWTSTIRREIARGEYEITWQTRTALADVSEAWHAPNRAHGFRTYFTPLGVRIVPRDAEGPAWQWRLELREWGRGDGRLPLTAAALRPAANRIDFERAGLVEWYVNDERGLEQGFTIPAPPPQHAAVAGPLVLRFDVGGDLDAHPSADGRVLHWTDARGAPRLRYAGLAAWDARGRRCDARFAIRGRSLEIRVEDADAVYPLTIDPLATSAAWTAESNQIDASFGFSVATAGDVNGDGYSDAIVGAYRYDNGDPNEGRAYLFLGSAAGLAVAPAWTAEGDFSITGTGVNFGVSVASAGDVNGDGFSDVVVGAYRYGANVQGRAFVYHGSAMGLSTSAAWTVQGPQSGEQYGFAVASAGDVNGDGFSDVIVGSPGYSGPFEGSEGRARVYHGSASGLATSAAWDVESNSLGANFGYSVGTAGDVNGDGFSDVIVGALLYSNGEAQEGRVWVFLGSASGLSPAAEWSLERNQAGANFGVSVGTAGDVNGDGFADVIVGAHRFSNDQVEEGRVWIYAGSPTGPTTPALWRVEGDQEGCRFGISVATAGDVNGDGFADVVVGADEYYVGAVQKGRAAVYLGSAAGPSTTPVWVVSGDQAGSGFGHSVATAGDVDGDGFSDVVVGAHDYDNGQAGEGRAFVFLGYAANPSVTASWAAAGAQAGAGFGVSAAGAGDVNGDGFSDVVVGADSYDNGEIDEGRAYVYLGSAAGIASAAAWTAESDQAGARLGASVAGAGDTDGDGFSDVIVGADSWDGGEIDEGRAYLFLGSPAGPAGAAAWSAEGEQAGAHFGASVAGAGDVNGDGYADAIVGADHHDSGQIDAGRAFTFLGSASGLAGAADWSADGGQAGARFGASVARAGDVDGDGFSDVVVGAPDFDGGQADEGAAFVFRGSGTGLSAGAAWSAESDQAGAHFGTSVASAGDVNGDGFADVIVGADGYDGGQIDEGRAYVYLGSASGLGALPDWTAESNRADARFGVSVASAGDVNGDGYSEVVVGADRYFNGQFGGGRASIYSGSASGPSLLATWHADGNEEAARFGHAVANAGDVNGDGFSDVIVGAHLGDGGVGDEGRALVFLGNDGDGLERTARQLRSDAATPIDVLGRSDAETEFVLAALGRSPAGRGEVRLQWEVAPLGTAFDGGGIDQGPWLDTGTPDSSQSAVALDADVSGLTAATRYRWRLRIATDSPLFPHSPWLSPASNARTETDLRTAGCIDADGDGYGAPADAACAGGILLDCDDADVGVHPGAVDVCDGFDFDCDGADALAPASAPVVSVGLTGGDPSLSWPALATATGYDLVQGDLASLSAGGGDFGDVECVADDQAATSWSPSGGPAVPDAAFFLVRGVNCAGDGSYDSAAASQVGDRDAEVEAAPLACP